MPMTSQPGTGEWRHGLFGCCESCSDCLLAYFCFPCYSYMAAKATGTDTLCACLACCFPFTLCCIRGTARAARGIDGSVVGDCMTVYCCTCCAAIQMKREFED